MKIDENIESALTALQAVKDAPDFPAAIIRLPPDSNAYVVGNRTGYIKLAIASLKAAQGNSQDFKHEQWVGTAELDWCLPGLRYDENADSYLGNGKSVGPRIVGGVGLILLVAPFLVGLGTIIFWLIQIFSKKG